MIVRTRALHLAAAVLIAVLAAPAAAFHQTTPPVVPLTSDGDTDLPRTLAQGRRSLVLAVPSGADVEITALEPFRAPGVVDVLAAAGDNANPSVSFSGRTFAWDSDADPAGTGNPGRQIVVNDRGLLGQPIDDPTGTSANPVLDKSGAAMAFDSEGDLAGTGNPGARQVFLRDRKGVVSQVSRGLGTSMRPVLSRKGGLLAFQSTSHRHTGADTGIAQIWIGTVRSLTANPITAGAGPSDTPSVSDDGRLVAFESTADLAGDGADTGTEQIFVYDTRSATYAQITDDASGCARPYVAKIGRDWRVTYVCGGAAFFYMLRADERYQVPTPGGHTNAIVPEVGIHFVTMSTTADLLMGGTMPGHRIYLVNLYKHPAVRLDGVATWFPSRGIPPF